jgi:hypothetical protein
VAFDPSTGHLPNITVADAVAQYRDNGFKGRDGLEGLLDSYDATYRSCSEEFIGCYIMSPESFNPLICPCIWLYIHL